MVDLKLEVVVIPVSGVDRAKEFYGGLGWRLDADFPFDNGFRVVQFTPPGAGCSVQFGANITSAVPGSARGLYLIVSAVTAALPPLTAALALEVAPVRVNLIAAGFVDTPLSASLLGTHLEERRDELRATLPIGRVVGPADVAALAVHIMTNTALTGATYDIDGGQQLVR